MPLQDCFRSISPWEYKLWINYLDKQFEQPSRTDYYLMQIAKVVYDLLSSKKSKKLKLKDFIIKPKKKKCSKSEAQETPDQSISRWVSMLNSFGGPKVRVKGKDI